MFWPAPGATAAPDASAWTVNVPRAAVHAVSTVAPLPADVRATVTVSPTPTNGLQPLPVVTTAGASASDQRAGAWPVHRLPEEDASLLRSELATIEELRALEPDSKCARERLRPV